MITKEFEAYTGQIWRDKDKRNVGRHVRLGLAVSSKGLPAFQAFACYCGGGVWTDHGLRPVKISLDNLRKRFELVFDPQSAEPVEPQKLQDVWEEFIDDILSGQEKSIFEVALSLRKFDKARAVLSNALSNDPRRALGE